MVELIDWDDREPQNTGTPGWYTLAQKISGQTRRPADRVFAAIENDAEGGRCRVLVAADIPEFGPEVMTPFSLSVRVTVEGVHTFTLIGATRTEEVGVATP